MDAKLKQLTIYERIGLDVTNLAVTLGLDPKRREDKEVLQRMHEEKRLYARFTPIMRFILTDEEQRHFSAERMRFSGIEHWITIADNGSISRLASTLIPTLGTERFFELI